MMPRVTITDANGKRFQGYVDDGNPADQKKIKLREHLHTVYLVVAITAFSIAIVFQLKRMKAKQ